MDGVNISMDVERYKQLIHRETILSVIDSLLDSTSDSVEFETAVRYILRERKEG